MAKPYKQEKGSYKKAKRTLVLPWKLAAVFSALIMLIAIPAGILVDLFDNTIMAMTGGTFTKYINKDSSAIYYECDFANQQQMHDYGLQLCHQVEAEGAALLMNNGALPLASGAKVSTLSSSSVDLFYGGTGSGNVNASKADSLKAALEKSGLVVNPTLWDFYTTGKGKNYRRSAGTGESIALPGHPTIAEVPMNVYPQNVLDSFTEYGDALIITISRVGGEGYDLEFTAFNYLALDKNEQDMMAYAAELKRDGKIKHIVVLLNTSNALQMDFLKNNVYDVDAILWVGGLGISGTNAITDILAGKVNPSGSLADTYCYNNLSSPAMQNFVPTTYRGYDGKNIPSHASTYMIYQEGIYVGYKYYETRYEDYVMGTGNAGSYIYSDNVAFPFGYGLSYSEFAYSDMNVVYNAPTDQFEVSITVTNNGPMTGKETVQVYSQSPYTSYDWENGVEKSSVTLCGFTKTGLIEPGQAETVTVYVDKRDLASYDAYGAGTYILDEGDYYLTVATDAHAAVNNTLTAKGYTAANTDGRMDGDGDASLVHKWTQNAFDVETYSTSLNGTPIVNRLSHADLNLYEGNNDTIVWLSRSDWERTWPRSIHQITLTGQMIEELQDLLYDPADYDALPMPILGADNGLKLHDMIGRDFDDPDWQKLLDQLTLDELVYMIGDSFHWRMPVESVNAPGTRDENGPQGLTASLFGIGSSLGDIEPTAFTSEDVMAATFNRELMYDVGNLIGNNCLWSGVACLYGPGSNTHRTPYGGRNFEYYSEDGFLAGELGGEEVRGIQAKGVDVVMKHFALNDCEQERLGQAVWVGEQAAREIYLKAFQKPLEECEGNGIMTAYTRWGTIWSGANKDLMTGIMRQEWGNRGFSITDNILLTYTNGVDAILAGGVTTCDAMLWYVTQQLSAYENDPVVVSAMRNAAHYSLYALANSSGMNGVGPDTTVRYVRPTLIGILRITAFASGVMFPVFLVLWILGVRKLRKTAEYTAYKTAKRNYKASK